jgi:hypothetical protein
MIIYCTDVEKERWRTDKGTGLSIEENDEGRIEATTARL